MRTVRLGTWTIVAAGLLLGAAAGRVGAADTCGVEDPVETLWDSYQEIRKKRDVESIRSRVEIARELAEIATEEALERLLGIFEEDKQRDVRWEAFRGILRSGDVALVWGTYQGIRKKRDVDTNRQRTEIAHTLAEIGSEEALERLLCILEKDKEPGPRLAAFRGLVRKGGVDLVARAVGEAGKDEKLLGRWLGTALSEAEDPAVGRWILEDSRLLKDSSTRIHAVEGLGALRVAEARSELLALHRKYRKSEREAPLVYETLCALGRIGDPCLRRTLLQAGLAGHPWERRAAAQFLPNFGIDDQEGRKVLRKLLADPDALVRWTAVASVGRMGATEYVREFIARLMDESLRVRGAARQALIGIAGVDLGQNPKVWKRWWEDRLQGGGMNHTFAKVDYDRIPADGVMFLIDISKSNSWQAPSMANRIDTAKERTAALIERLDERTLFNVMAVCGRPFPWRKTGKRDGGMVLATKENKKEAIAWVRGLECKVHTNTWDALETAFEDLPVLDSIYYVTDGAFRLSTYVFWEELPMRVKEINRLRGVQIHVHYLHWGGLLTWAFAYDDVEEQRGWLEGIARQTGGTFEMQTQP
jgi:HEAT repeat protein